MISLPDVPRLDNPGLFELLLAMRKQVLSSAQVIEQVQAEFGELELPDAPDTGGGCGGYINMPAGSRLYWDATCNVWSGVVAGVWELNNGAGRLRLGTSSLISNVDIQGGRDIHAQRDLITSSSAYGLFQGAVTFGSGSNDYIGFNAGLDRFEFYVNGVRVFTIP